MEKQAIKEQFKIAMDIIYSLLPDNPAEESELKSALYQLYDNMIEIRTLLEQKGN